MTKVAVYTNKDGGLNVLIPADPAMIESIAERDIPSGTEYHIIDRSELPQDRTFRNAWKHEEGVVSHCMDKCREIHKAHLREKRAPLLAALDLEYMRADEEGDAMKKNRIAADKQSLRDITKHPDIASAKTPEELKLAGKL